MKANFEMLNWLFTFCVCQKSIIMNGSFAFFLDHYILLFLVLLLLLLIAGTTTFLFKIQTYLSTFLLQCFKFRFWVVCRKVVFNKKKKQKQCAKMLWNNWWKNAAFEFPITLHHRKQNLRLEMMMMMVFLTLFSHCHFFIFYDYLCSFWLFHAMTNSLRCK